jgi:hypothetical protein
MSFKGLVLGFTVGLGIGASLDFLYAPQTGKESRKKLRKWISEGFFKARWQIMSPEERYIYFWARSRRQRRQACEATAIE